MKQHLGVDFKRTSIADLSADNRLDMFSSALRLNRPPFSEGKELPRIKPQDTPGTAVATHRVRAAAKGVDDNAQDAQDQPTEQISNQDRPDILTDNEGHQQEITVSEVSVVKTHENNIGPTEETVRFLMREKPIDQLAQQINPNDPEASFPDRPTSNEMVEDDDSEMLNDTTSEKSLQNTSGIEEAIVESIFIETTYNLTERRSSRSTFRTRTSARMPSQTSFLSDHNMEMIGLKSVGKSRNLRHKLSKDKNNMEHFFIDYGDGVLHDTMKIPRVKDCARPWCNPHCKTCKNRAHSRPCFVLVPTDENSRRSKLPIDPRASLSPMFKTAVGKNKRPAKIGNRPPEKDEEKEDAEKNDSNKQEDWTEEQNGSNDEEDNASESDSFTSEIRKMILRNISPGRKPGYNRTRMGELAQPRYGPPAEVRFSKMSLRKKQDELKEFERTKELSKMEQENLAFIQGKISVFCALLQEDEVKGRPAHVTSLQVVNERPPTRKKSSARKRVMFSQSPRYN